MKIAIFGLGGIGGLVGGALARVNADTYFYTRGESLRVVGEQGLSVDSVQLGQFCAHPKLVTDQAAEIGIVDLLIVATKGYGLDKVCAAASPMIGPQTVVMPLLNGVLVSEIMVPLLPPCILADGCIYVFSYLTAPGYVRQHAGSCSIRFGLKDGTCPPVFQEIEALLNQAGVQTKISPDIRMESWKKYVLMCGNSVVFSYYDAPAGPIQQIPNILARLRVVYGELINVAAAQGVSLPEGLAERYADGFMKFTSETTTSLYRDLKDGKAVEQTELAHLVGRLVEMGRACGVAVPFHEAVWEKYQG